MSETYELFQEGRARLSKGMAAQATVPLEKAKAREPAKASIREPIVTLLGRDRPPYELGRAFQRAVDEGMTVLGFGIGPTRDLTRPVDLVERNFPYLAGR